MQRSQVTSEPLREEGTVWKTKAGEGLAQTHHHCLYDSKELSKWWI